MKKNNSLLNSLPFQGKEATKNYGFTLVELIVVITILAILGTIAFISLQGYSKDARDSVRISDISKIKTSLELFQLDAGKYPETTEATNITYSGAIAWTQGTFGEATFNNVIKLDKIPLDPVTERKYIYSVTNTKQEYQIAGVMEGDEVTGLLNKTNAVLKTAMLKISGTYNGKILKVNTGGINYVLAVPSIITSSGFTLEQIVANKYLAYNGYKNLPAQYAGSSYDVLGDGGIKLVNTSDLVVYSGDLKTLSDTTPTGTSARKNLITKLQNAYAGTAITNVGEIAQIINTDIDNETATEFLSNTIVSNNLGGSVAVSSGGGSGTSTNSCATQPSYTHATFTVGTPTSVNQAYVQNATNCGYTCTDGYTGTSCEIAPGLITSTSCTNANWIWVDDTTDTIGNGFCISPRVTGGTEYISWMDIGTAYSWTRTNSSPMTAANAYADNQYGVTYDLGAYSCKTIGTSTSGFTKSDNSDSTLSSDDTIENRMRYLAKYKTDSIKIDDVNIDWVTVPSIPAGFSVPALYLSDCMDGTRDLNTGKTYDGVDYSTYSNTTTNTDASRILRNRYLLGWTKQVGSHLPSAYSDISSEITDMLTVNKGEYQIACEAGKFGTVTGTAGNLTGSEDDTANMRIRLSAVGGTTGTNWGRDARIVGYRGCGDQDYVYAGYRHGNVSARFVVRP